MQPRSLMLGLAAVGGLLLAERLWPRRAAPVEPARLKTNLVLGVANLAFVGGVQGPLAKQVAGRVAQRRQGLAQALGPVWARDLVAMLLLDWSNYHWHVATHRVPLLWRLHRVHHVDRQMDASTALRFHLVDMAVTVPLRLMQIRLFGVSPRALAWWEGFFLGSVLFHHADLDLPFDAELAWLLTTPGMHDIHHRAEAAALDSNFSAGLSLWDRLHGSFSSAAPAVPIGVPEPVPADVGLSAMLALPWRQGQGLAGPPENITMQ